MKMTPVKRLAPKVSAQPLLRRLTDRGVSQSEFVRELRYSPADLTN